MNFVRLLLVGFSFTCTIVTAQNYFTVKGFVQTAQNMKIQNAHIYVPSLGIGVTTNADGYFELNLPAVAKGESMVVSHIGYKKETNPVSGGNEVLSITLEEDVLALNEIEIRGLSPATVMLKVIENLPINYAESPCYMTAFNREEFYENESLIYIGEALTKTYSVPYYDFVSDNQVCVLKGQYVEKKEKLKRNEVKGVDVINGITGTVFLDIIKRKRSFIKKATLAKYVFEFGEDIASEGRACYQIKFNTDYENYKGVFVIEKGSYAIVSAEIALTKKGLADLKTNGLVVTSFEIKAQYRKDGSTNRWYFTQGQALVNFFGVKEVVRKIIVQCVVTQLGLEKVVPFRSGEVTRNSTFAFSVKKKYDSSFWSNQNIIRPPKNYYK